MSITYLKYLKRKHTIIVTLAIMICAQHDVVFSQSSEYEMKAVAFEKLSLFIEWPPTAFDRTQNEFIIAVLGQNPFGNTLEEVYANHTIKDRPVKIIYIKDIHQLTNCHILFISGNEKSELNNILNLIKTKPVLTIAETEGFAEAGCFINFYNYDGKLRFEINQKAMESAGFTIDYKLLRVSKIVNSGIE